MITKFKLFESYDEVKSICDKYNIKNWEVNPETGRVNVEGDVDLSGRGLQKIPVEFGEIGGNFYCNDNQLTSLEEGPNSVGGDFYCNDNQLTSLEEGPNSVGGDFYCSNNQLTSLRGGPNSVGGDFYCNDNQLTSLEEGPNSVGGNFYCYDNQLTSLRGSPNSVGGNFYCYDNQLVDFMVPEYSINDDVEFRCEWNPIFEIYQLFMTPKCIDLINEFEVIRPGKVIIRDRLEEVFSVLEMRIPEFRFKEWKLLD